MLAINQSNNHTNTASEQHPWMEAIIGKDYLVYNRRKSCNLRIVEPTKFEGLSERN